MIAKRIYTFWEPKGQVIPYLELCRKTWDINLPGYEIITLDYSNLFEYIEEDVYDFPILKRLSLPLQKTAILVAVLKEHGGVFMDMDTLAFDDIAPVIAKLEQSEVVMFSSHTAFVASRANSRLLSLWHQGIQNKLLHLRNTGIPENLHWGYIGANVLVEVKDEMVGTLLVERYFHNQFFDLVFETMKRLSTWEQINGSRISDILNRGRSVFYNRRKALYFKTVLKSFLHMLDRERYGFIVEATKYRTRSMTGPEKYNKFWFEEDLSLDEVVLKNNPMVVGLHNSWTPGWYREMSQEKILNQDCLLSRTLYYLLNKSH